MPCYQVASAWERKGLTRYPVYQHLEAHSVKHAKLIAIALGFDPSSVERVPDTEVGQLDQSAIIRAADVGVPATSPMFARRPILTITVGVMCGILGAFLIVFLLSIVLGGRLSVAA